MQRISIAIFSLCSFLFTHSLIAQDGDFSPITTDRPSFGVGAFVVAPGTFQIETGFQYTVNNSSIPANAAPGLRFEAFSFNNTLLRYGISDRIELRFTQNLQGSRFRLDGETTETNPTRFAPTGIGAKIGLVEDHEELPDISVLTNLGGPILSNDGSGTFLDGSILISGAVFQNFGLNVNFGTAWLNELSTISYQYALALSKSLTEKLSFYIESYGILPEDSRFEEHNVNGGIIYLLSNSTQLDFFGGTGFSRFSPSIFMGFGFSKRFQ